MKKHFFPFVMVASLFFLALPCANAQMASDISMVPRQNGERFEKNTFSDNAGTSMRSAEYVEQKCARMVKNLRNQFPKGANIQYYETPEGFYISMTEFGNACQVSYDANQRFRYSIIKVDEKALPEFLTRQLENQYPGFAVQSAFKVNHAGAPAIHRVILKGQQQFVEVLVGDEEITEVNKVNGK